MVEKQENLGTSALKELLEVEERGIEPVPEAEQTSNPSELFWIWFAGNISILGLPLGIWVVAGELNFWQALLAGVIGSVASFAIVGVVSVAGQRGRAPSLTLSRATFGQVGNFGPTIVAILSRWGWETVNTVTAAFAVLSIATIVTGTEKTPENSPLLAIVSVALFIILTLLVSGLGHRMLAIFQQVATYIFGALTLVVIVNIAMNTDWQVVLSAETGSWSTFLLGIGVVASGTGLAWANSGADIGRYQSPHVRATTMIASCAAGAGIPLVIMIGAGSLVGITHPNFDTDNPLASIPALLPPWMAIPFLIAAFAGLLLSNNISVYSSGLTLLTLGIKTRRIVAVAIELCMSFVGSLLFFFVLEDFYASFIGFIVLLAVPLTAWLGVFLVDMVKRSQYSEDDLMDVSAHSSYWYVAGCEFRAIAAWLIAIVIGFWSQNGPIFGWSFIADNGLSWLVTLILAAGIYAALGGAQPKQLTSQ